MHNVQQPPLGVQETEQLEGLFANKLAQLGMDRDTFLSTQKNPFTKPILLYTLGIFLLVGGIDALISWGVPEFIAAVAPFAVLYYILSVIRLIIQFSQFKKTKRWYREEYEPFMRQTTPSPSYPKEDIP